LLRLEEVRPGATIAAIGHRVVHGGTKYSQPLIVDDQTLAEITIMSTVSPPRELPFRVSPRLPDPD
jgi:acetate kinase